MQYSNNPRPVCSTSYFVVPRANDRAVLAFKSTELKRYFAVAAIGEPIDPRMPPLPRLAQYPMPHLPNL